MRRATTLIVLFALSGLMLSGGGCNPHPLEDVEYDHFTGSDSGTEEGDSSSSSDESGSDESGTGEGSTGVKFDVGPECGNGILEPGEQCDDGDANGVPPATCGVECIWNIS